jgi:AhpD family alkylhydroperoxidase
MSRIEPRKGILADLFALGARRSFGRDLESARVFAHHPRLSFGWLRYNRAAEHPRHVPKLLAELGVLRAASMVGCEFCIDISSEYVRRAGLTDEQLLSLHEAHSSGLFDADQLMVIDLATGMSSTPGQVDDELMERVEERLGVKGTLELTQLIAWENARARQNVALGIGPAGFSEGKACARPYTAAGIDSMSITKRNLTSPASIRL